jgi:NAD(P)-dependent dehydrogenase (short-subunit alcohol dehydrogenase family)
LIDSPPVGADREDGVDSSKIDNPCLSCLSFGLALPRRPSMISATAGVVLVTGAASGIGRACALYLAQHGFRVFATTRRSLAGVSADLRAELPPEARLEVLFMDSTSDDSVREAFECVMRGAGHIDAVVHCAGFGVGGAVEDTDDDEAKAIFETNFFGTLRMCRAALPTMRCQGSGTLVVVSSIGGRMGLPFQGLYSATKFAVEGLLEAVSLEVRPFGVRVAILEPGDFRTGFTDHRSRVRRSREGSGYGDAFANALVVIEADERRGRTPEPIARLVLRILTSRRVKLRYTVGPLPQRLAVQLKKVLPGRAFESILGLYYRIGVRASRAVTRQARGGRCG